MDEITSPEGEGHFVCACAYKICSAPSASFWNFQRPSAGFQLGDWHLFVIFFGEGWKSMTSLPPFLTLWILVEFAGSSDEDILMIKVRTKREKRPKTWSLRFDLLTIKMCTRGNKPWRLVLRCWCLTSVNHEVVCRDDREILVTIIAELAERSPIIIQNNSNSSSRKSLDVRPYDRTAGTPTPRLCSEVQWSVHWAPSWTTWVLVLAGARCCALETNGKKNASSAFSLG